MTPIKGLIIAVVAVSASPAGAIVIRHDKPDRDYLVRESAFPTVAKVMNGGAESVLIAPQWAITAAHAVEYVDPFSRWRITIDGTEHAVSKIILHPKREQGAINSDYDLALLKLDRPVANVTPTPLYRWNDEGLQIATIVGRGGTKTGAAGAGDFRRDDRMRRATNKIQAAFAYSLVTTFDAPPFATELEGAGGPRDSGGPAFLTKDGVQYLAGVGSFGSPPGEERGTYGTLDGFARVSAHRQWIEATISSDPPSTLPKWSREHLVARAGDWPETPAGQLARQFFKAYRAGAKQAAAFVGETSADGLATWGRRAAEWGELQPFSYRTLGNSDIAFIAFASRANEWRGFWIKADPENPGRVTSLLTGGVGRPENAPEQLPRR